MAIEEGRGRMLAEPKGPVGKSGCQLYIDALVISDEGSASIPNASLRSAGEPGLPESLTAPNDRGPSTKENW